ncbi:hypothetical protein D3C81_1447730 [compost metagenome]
MRLGIGNQLGHRLDRQLGIDHQHEWQVAHAADRREVLDRVIGQLLHQRRVGRMRGVGGHEQRIAVRGRLRNQLRRDGAVGAGAIVDHHVLAERIAQFLGRDARDGIGAAAGGKRHDKADRTAGPAISSVDSGGKRQRCQRGQRQDGGGKHAPRTESRHGGLLGFLYRQAARIQAGRMTRSGDSS